MEATGSVRPSAFSMLAATLIAPEDAFAAIRERPLWVWAMLVTLVLASLGSWLGTPALRHMIEVTMTAQLANDPHIASLPPDRAAAETQRLVAAGARMANYSWMFSIVVVPIVVLVESTILFLIRSLVRSQASFAQLFSLTMHVQFISIGIGSIVLGIVVALHPASSFRTQGDFISSIPTAAWLFPGAPLKMTTALSSLSPFTIWATAVLGLGLTAVANFTRAVAWITAIGLLLAGAGWAAFFAR